MFWEKSNKYSLWLMGISIIVVLMAFLGRAEATAGLNSARSVGMGGSYTALARGIEAPDWNPANLGLDFSENRWSFAILNAGLQVFNDSYAKSHYDQYNGQDISNVKQKILDEIEGDELDLVANAGIQVFAISYRAFAFTVQAQAFSKLALAKSLLELPFFGNTKNPAYQFTPVTGNGIVLWQIGYSGAYPITIPGFEEAAAGASMNFYTGKSIFEVTYAHGQCITTDSYISASGEIRVRQSLGGRGFGIDAGIAGRSYSGFYLSVAIKNLVSYLNWNKKAQSLQYSFNLKNTNVADWGTAKDFAELYQTSEDTLEHSSFSTRLPETFRFGIAKKLSGLIVAIDYEQGLRNYAGVSLKPLFSGGLEFATAKAFAIRTGISHGGNIGRAYAIGFGFGMGSFQWHIGVNLVRELTPANTRGMTIASSMKLIF